METGLAHGRSSGYVMGNFNRYSHHARRALTHAGLLVARYRHPRIDTSHLLVGVMLAEGSIGHSVLHELGLSAAEAEPRLADLTLSLDSAPEVLNNDAALDIALELAADESDWLGHHYVGTEHLLLGITRTNLGNAADLLNQLGISSEQVRRRVRRAVSAGETEFNLQSFRRNVRFSELARRVINAAEQISVSLDHQTVGLGHLLVALANERRGPASAVLHQSGMDIDRLSQDLHLREDALLNSIESLLHHANEIAANSGSHYTGTEHLLIALTMHKDAVHLLHAYHVDPSALRRSVEQQLHNKR
jgi:ATP-dependent Clp protease ATP-binding subunit ClpA